MKLALTSLIALVGIHCVLALPQTSPGTKDVNPAPADVTEAWKLVIRQVAPFMMSLKADLIPPEHYPKIIALARTWDALKDSPVSDEDAEKYGLSEPKDGPRLDVSNSGNVNGMEVTVSVVRNPKNQLHELRLKILNGSHQEIRGLQYIDNIPCECVMKMKDQNGLNCALTRIGEVRFGSKRSGFRQACTGFSILKGNEMIWTVPLKYYFKLYPATWELEFDLAPFRFYSTVPNDQGDGYPNAFVIKVGSIVINELDFEDLKR